MGDAIPEALPPVLTANPPNDFFSEDFSPHYKPDPPA